MGMGSGTLVSHGPISRISRPGYLLEQAAQIQWKVYNQNDRCMLVSWSCSCCRSSRRRLAKEWKTACLLATSSYHLVGGSVNGTIKLNSCQGGSRKTVTRYSRSIQSMRNSFEKFEFFIPTGSCNVDLTKVGKLRKLGVSCKVKSQHSESAELSDLKFGSPIDNGNDIAADHIQLSKLRSDSVNFSKVLDNVVSEKDVEEGFSGWEEFPRRWVIVILCFFAFLLCNMDRVNMSIAILPMSAEFNWSPTIVGLIQSSFFWGYLLTQIAGGIWADKVGGKLVLGFGVIWWSVATMLTPVAANIGLPALLLVRACMGIGEGVAMPAMSNLLSRWIPVEERSRSLALVYSGMYLGSVTGLAFSPTLIHNFGWPSVFFSFGSLGAVWFATWQKNGYSSPLEDPHLHAEEKNLILGKSKPKECVESIPWRLLLSKPPVWALITSHFCHNWGTFILLTWMPTYYNQVLKFNLTESGLFCVLPWFTMALSANLGGWIADTLVSRAADAGKSGTHEMEKDEELQGFIDLWKRMFGFMDSLGLPWAVELEIPDIIAKHGLQSMLSAEEIASYLPSPSPNMDFLSRILSFLAMRGIFTQTLLPNTQLIKYGLTPISKWLVKTRSSEGEGLQGCSMNPMVLMQTHEAVIAPWYRMGDCTVSASATFPFELVHGKLLFSFAKENPEFGRVFNNAMASHSKQLMKDILEAYGDGFSKLSFMSLVDVGGGDGSTISNIALAFPDIKCFNYDLPQVIRGAPTYAGVQHVAGDMFLSVPQSDAVMMKLILHDWGDEECIKLLKNCRGAIPKQGKLILVDVVLLDPGERKKKLSGFEEIGVMMDMVMLAHQRGKERREGQWKQLLQASGFNRYRIIHLPSQMSIIEAFPQ